MYRPRHVTKLYGGTNRYVEFLYYLAKFWGLAPFILEDNEVSRGSWSTKIYPFIFTAICLPFTELMLMNWINMDFTGDTKISKYTSVTAIQLRIFAVTLSTLSFARERINIVKLINRLVKADETLRSIGIQQDYETKFKEIAIRIICLSCIIFVSDYILILFFFEGAKSSWYINSIGQIFCITHHLVIFIFVSSMLVVNDRLKQLNRMLSNLCNWKCKSIIVCGRGGMFANQVTPNTTTMVAGTSSRADIPVADNPQLFQIFVKIERVQSDLHDVVEKIAQLFSVPLFLIIGYYFLNILSESYFAYLNFVDLFQNPNSEIIIELIGVGLSVSIQALELFAVASVCATIEKTGKSTAIKLHKMWVEYHPHFLKDEIQMLSLQLLQRPLTISAFGFFSLDYSYLYKIFCAVVAYFVIMVQLDTSKLESAQNVSTLAPNVTGMH